MADAEFLTDLLSAADDSAHSDADLGSFVRSYRNTLARLASPPAIMADDTVTVTQADEDFAIENAGLLACPSYAQDLAEAAARHRLATKARPASTVPGDVVARAEAWLRECSSWLLTNDLDMVCPMEVDPLDIADALAALSQGRDGLVEALEAVVAEADRGIKECPVNNPALSTGSRSACTKCGHGPDKNCPSLDGANYRAVQIARAALREAQP